MKKVITMAIAAIALTALFAGCGKPCNYSNLIGTYEGKDLDGNKIVVEVGRGYIIERVNGKEIKEEVKSACTKQSVVSSGKLLLFLQKDKSGAYTFSTIKALGGIDMKRIK